MVNLQSLKGMPQAKVAAPPPRDSEGSGLRGASTKGTPRKKSGSPEAGRPKKIAKTGTRKVYKSSVARKGATPGLSEVGVAPQGDGQTSARGKGVASSSGNDPSRKPSTHPKSMRDLCRVRPRAAGEPFQALSKVDLPMGEPGAPYASRWATLKADSRIWADGSAAQEFSRGALHPVLAKELYCSSSVVLMDRAARSLVWGQHYTMALIDRVYDVGRVIERLLDANSNLCQEVEELKNRPDPEAIAAAK
ncbi:hypothetical protein C4D60_Mb10t26790 [Musa balbisiana]|uniref:Uncharacterized protein n=1 Tax=Musa balbisiana TaxID=52838 RepID=A0A4S8IZZ7_MUSBA|nr:hypothetical protein C4D60_Mb10t26790 [Musa balbisiana]